MKYYKLLTELTDKETKQANRASQKRPLRLSFGPIFKSARTVIKTMKINDDLLLRQYNLLRSNNASDINVDTIQHSLENTLKQKSKQKIKDIDVSNNKAVLDDGREMKITKLISKINNENEYYIVISHDPHDIAGMSTDKSWSSCTNIRDGAYKSLPFKEIKSGGMVAYLMMGIPKDMQKVMNDHKENGLFQQNAISRISIRRFENRNYNYRTGYNDFIFMPETRCYDVVGGTDVLKKTKFQETVKDSLEENNKMTTDYNVATYHRKGGEYSDTFGKERKLQYYNPKTINDLPEQDQLEIINKSENGEPVLHIKNPSADVMLKAIKKHSGRLFHFKDMELPDKVLKYVSKEPISLMNNYYLYHKDKDIPENVLMNMIKSDDTVIRKLKDFNLPEKVQKKIISVNPLNIKYIKTPLTSIQDLALSKNLQSMKYIDPKDLDKTIKNKYIKQYNLKKKDFNKEDKEISKFVDDNFKL